jgi:hypothetical protein
MAENFRAAEVRKGREERLGRTRLIDRNIA